MKRGLLAGKGTAIVAAIDRHYRFLMLAFMVAELILLAMLVWKEW